jgi:hypothetical protein
VPPLKIIITSTQTFTDFTDVMSILFGEYTPENGISNSTSLLILESPGFLTNNSRCRTCSKYKHNIHKLFGE